MAKSFFQRIETAEGEVTIHVNRRSCKGPWTEEMDFHMRALVEALQKMDREGMLPRPAAEETR